MVEYLKQLRPDKPQMRSADKKFVVNGGFDHYYKNPKFTDEEIQ